MLSCLAQSHPFLLCLQVCLPSHCCHFPPLPFQVHPLSEPRDLIITRCTRDELEANEDIPVDVRGILLLIQRRAAASTDAPLSERKMAKVATEMGMGRVEASAAMDDNRKRYNSESQVRTSEKRKRARGMGKDED